ncbi:MAG: CDP-alcohol phosphatidyltransferase family protein [Bacteroidales bacterium]|nr:CDP-alcohol phosphatidyltransferase family protein [Bacteroidales bacterium]
MSNISIESTLKSSDTEEWIDIYFYRKIGYAIAWASMKANISPNALTIISIFWGMAAGHLFYYSNLWINVIGIVCLVIANSLDSADGQLARMTNNKTKLGRILDGLAGNIWFVTIYIHLLLRLLHEGYGYWVIVLFAVTGASHIFQAALADYYRNAHLYIINGEEGSEFDNSSKVKKEYEKLLWKKHFFEKLFTCTYINYTREQELFTKNLQKLVQLIKVKFNGKLPVSIQKDLRKENKVLMPITNILSFNTRAIALFICLISGQVIWYWVFEFTILNFLLLYMIGKQERISKKYFAILNNI